MPRYDIFIPKSGKVNNVSFDTTSRNLALVLGAEKVANGTFDSDTVWIKGAGWTIASGVATATTASSALEQNITAVNGEIYELTYVLTVTAGSVIPQIGGVNGTSRTASGTYKESIKATGTGNLKFTGTGLSGTVDNVNVKKVSEGSFVSLVSTSACYYRLGDKDITVSSSTGQYLPANVIRDIGLQHHTHIAVIQATATGTLVTSELDETI